MRFGVGLLAVVIVAGLAAGEAWLPAAFADESYDFEVVSTDDIYYGSGKHPKTPAVTSADDVWDEIPEYKKIVEDELTEEDPSYHLLMRKASERFQKALKKLAKRDGRDMIGEVGSIKATGEKKSIPDVTKALIKLVKRA